MMRTDTLSRIVTVVEHVSGLRLSAGDDSIVRRIVDERMSATRCRTLEDYFGYLGENEAHRTEETRIVASMLLVGESYFFRDQGQFALLRRAIIPAILKNKPSLRIWSAGCAAGEEPYSVAIMLREMPEITRDTDIRIIASDVSTEALKSAKAATYGEWSFRMAPDELKRRYFALSNGRYTLNPDIRRMVQFVQADLREDRFPDHTAGLHDFDLIICRNLFIYYRQKAIGAMLKNMTKTLQPGGYLMTGHGELYALPMRAFKGVLFPEGMIYQYRDQSSVPFSNSPIPPSPPPAAAPIVVSAMPEPLPSTPSASVAFSLQTMLEKVERLLANGRHREAAALLEGLLIENPANADLLCLKATALANMGQTEEAGQLLEKAKKASPLHPEPYFLQAQICLERNDEHAAITELEKAIYIDRTFIAAYLELALLYQNAKKPEKAAKLRAAAMKELERLPGYAAARHVEGETISRLKQKMAATAAPSSWPRGNKGMH